MLSGLMLTVLMRLAAAPSADGSTPPRFEDYAVTKTFSGKPARPDVSAGKAHLYRTEIRRQSKQGPNFASHFTVIQWGCGTCCHEFGIVDARTGRVHFPKAISVVGCLMPPEAQDSALVDYRLDSRLLIVTGATDELEGGRYFYLWDGDNLTLVFSLTQRSDGTLAPI
jgi:hypothetical protein